LDEARRVFETENARIAAGDAMVRSFRKEKSVSLDLWDGSAYQLSYTAEVECIRDARGTSPSDALPCRAGLILVDRGSIFFVKGEEGWRGSLRDHQESVAG
jgi:hypothetical protein